jgi:hypothetical protein
VQGLRAIEKRPYLLQKGREPAREQGKSLRTHCKRISIFCMDYNAFNCLQRLFANADF